MGNFFHQDLDETRWSSSSGSSWPRWMACQKMQPSKKYLSNQNSLKITFLDLITFLLSSVVIGGEGRKCPNGILLRPLSFSSLKHSGAYFIKQFSKSTTFHLPVSFARTLEGSWSRGWSRKKPWWCWTHNPLVRSHVVHCWATTVQQMYLSCTGLNVDS